MQGLMMDRPLLVSSILEHASTIHHDQEVVTRTVEGPIHRYTYADLARRSRRLARALTDLGIGRGDRVGTVAWNTHRHLELYYGVAGMGAVCHTLNPRLHPEQFAWIVNHAGDRLLFVDATFVKLVEAVADKLTTVERVVVMTDRATMPETSLPDPLCYEDIVEAADDRFDWPALEEGAAAAMCYTSGTTGDPKGVVYSNRSVVLHAYGLSLPGALPVGERDALLPVVPQFHVLAWGFPYAVPMNGGKLVMPGPRLDGASLTELMAAEGVTVTAGVPTVWHGLLEHWRTSGERVPSLRRVVVGGSAAPRRMIEAFQETYGIAFIHAWGMTETSPLGTASYLKPADLDAEASARYDRQVKQGRPVFGVEARIVDEAGAPLPRDGVAFGELQVRGPWVCTGYHRLEVSPGHTADGWFATGDVATIDPDGYVQITDRKKDLIKSGGEWISSIDLEDLAMSHPDVQQAAVIGVPDPRWEERPLLIVVPVAGTEPDKEAIRAHLGERVAKWQVPDDVVFVESLPLGATGKVLKSRLRETYGGGAS